MKFTVAFVTLLSITSSWAVLAKRVEEPKEKREAPTSYPQSSSGQSSSSYQAPSLGHGDASAISVGAGYSIGGAKPTFSFGGQGSGTGFQLSAEGLQPSQGGALQLAPITLQPGQDLAQIMSQLQQSLGSGALSLQPSNSIGEFHENGQGGQAYSFPQFQQYAAPQYQQYQLGGQIASAPSYSAGTKGLSSYGQTGPVLFNPSQDNGGQQAFGYSLPGSGHQASDGGSLSLGGAGQSLAGLSLGSGHSFGGLSAAPSSGGSGYSLAGLGHSLGGAGLSFDGTGFSLGGSGHSLGGSGQPLGGSGYSLGSLSGSGQSLGGSGYSLGGSGYSLGGSGQSEGSSGYSSGGSGKHSFGGSIANSLGGSGGHSLGGSGSSQGGSGQSYGGSGSSSGAHYKVLSSGGKSAFKPSTFLGASVSSDSGLSSLSGSQSSSSFPSFSSSHGSLSFGGHSFPGFPGFGGSSKHISPLYTKAEGSYDSAGAYSSTGHLASPPGTTYGFPTSSYSSGGVRAASSDGPKYYVNPSKYSSSFGEGSSSYKSPSSSHSSFSSHSSGPKYSFGGHNSRYSSPKDSHGAYSETTYNTIKYSEELKPHIH